MLVNTALEKKIYYILRLSIAMCFIGHGVFGIITKPVWCNYFAVFGIGHHTAYRLMPIVGSLDVLMGLIMLIYPIRAFAVWLVIWGVITASLRPLSGEPIAEMVERAGNFGAPLAFLLLCGLNRNIRSWFRLVQPVDSASSSTIKKVEAGLKVVVCLLLAGHCWLNLIEKHSLLEQYRSLGFGNAAQVARYVGLFELGAAASVWIDALNPLILLLFVWKIATELFYPHYELLEFVERGGSYGTLLALYLVRRHNLPLRYPAVSKFSFKTYLSTPN